MTKTPSKKSRVRPSRTTAAGSKSSPKGHSARRGAPTAAKKPKPAPKRQRGERPLRGPTKAEAMLMHITGTPTSLSDLATQFGILPHSARAILSVTSRQQGLVVRSIDGLLTVVTE